MFVFLALSILYPNDRLSGFAMAMKTCRAATAGVLSLLAKVEGGI